ncbi:unnamed protein product [Orchesella dallaii]|uniref:Uncharacterized protein n=1 Tax=Orchesella dallaii TaxID=48710 RepID=A0ABP1Q7E1_9HEXA
MNLLYKIPERRATEWLVNLNKAVRLDLNPAEEAQTNDLIPKSATYSLNEFESEVKKLKAHGKDLELSENAVSSLRRTFAHCTKLNVRNNHPSYEIVIEPLKERAINMKFKSGTPFEYAYLSEPTKAIYSVSGNKMIGNETLANGATFEVEITFGDELLMTRKSKNVSFELRFPRLGIAGNKSKTLIPKAATFIASLYGYDVGDKLKEHGDDIGLKSVYLDVLLDMLKPMSIMKIKNTHPHYLLQFTGIPNDGLQFNNGEPFEYFAFGKTCKAFYTVSGNKIIGKEVLKDAGGYSGGEYEVQFVYIEKMNTLEMTRKSESVSVKITYIKSLL